MELLYLILLDLARRGWGWRLLNMAATGANIKALLKARGLKVADVQIICGFNTPQAIFKWMRGDAMPSIDNLVILAHMLGVTIDQIIIIN